MFYQARHRDDISVRNEWDELGFDEFSVDTGNATKKRALIEQYLFSKQTRKQRLVPQEEAMYALEYIIDIGISQYNKLREIYKEVYLMMKTNPMLSMNPLLKFVEKRKYLEEYTYHEELDFIELNLANEFGHRHATEVNRPRLSTIRRKNPVPRAGGHYEDESGFKYTSVEEDSSTIDTENTTKHVPTLDCQPAAESVNDTDFLKPRKVIDKIREEKDRLFKDTKSLWKKYQDLLKFDHNHVFAYFESKYGLHYQRSVKKRTISYNIDELDDMMDDHDLVNSKVVKRREKFLKFQQKDTARGLPDIRNLYETYCKPILVEEVYLPNDSESSVKLEETKESEIDPQLSSYFPVLAKTHIIFLLHGYLGNSEDMERVASVIAQRSKHARVHLVS